MVDPEQWSALEARVTALERRPPPPPPPNKKPTAVPTAEQVEELQAAVKELQGAIRVIWKRLNDLEERPATYNQLQQQVTNLAAAVRRLEQGDGDTPMPGY